MEVVQLPGSQGFWQHQVLRGIGSQGSREYNALEGYGNQFWPRCSSILAWRSTLPLTEGPGRPQSIGWQRVGHDQVTVCTSTQAFLPAAALPQLELSVKVVQQLGLQGPWKCQVCRDMDCLSAGVMALSESFFRGSCSWQSEGFFGQSFSIAPPIQALRGLPCLGSFSVVWHIRHIDGPPGWVLLCRSVHYAL